jgi:hypothetical protein
MDRKSRKAEPSFDDPRWRPLRDEYKLISRHCGHSQLAYGYLNKALANGRVRSMRRHIVSLEPERLPPEFWVNHELSLWSEHEGLIVVPLRPDRRVFADPVRDFALFLWHPDVEKVWPALRQADDEGAPPRAKPGPKPTGDWHTLIAQWLIAVAADQPKRLRNVNVLVVQAAAFLAEEINWSPKEDKELRKKIVELLKLVPR